MSVAHDLPNLPKRQRETPAYCDTSKGVIKKEKTNLAAGIGKF